MTDAAVIAAHSAIYNNFGNIVMPRWDVSEAVVAAARPIIEAECQANFDLALRQTVTYRAIEAEVRERIAAEVRAEVAATAPVVEIVETLGQPTTCRVTVEGVVRFIGQSHPLDGDFTRGYREGYIDADNGYAARIARGGAS